jgi:hypothetical protein
MHVLLRVGQLDGKPQFEPVHVEAASEDHFKVLYSPGLAYEVAAGDTIRVDEAGDYEVLDRGGNISVRLYSKRLIDDELGALQEEFEALGGTLDGQVPKAAVFTVPASMNIPRVREIMRKFLAAHNDCIWEFGNIFDAQGKPLEWCKPLLANSEA